MSYLDVCVETQLKRTGGLKTLQREDSQEEGTLGTKMPASRDKIPISEKHQRLVWPKREGWIMMGPESWEVSSPNDDFEFYPTPDGGHRPRVVYDRGAMIQCLFIVNRTFGVMKGLNTQAKRRINKVYPIKEVEISTICKASSRSPSCEQHH